MYFFTDEERKFLVRGLLPKAREQGVADELRGWNWHQPPLAPIYELRLGVSEVASGYCPTARDLYLRRVRGIRPPAGPAMLRGTALHAAMVHVLVNAKRLIYHHGVAKHHIIVRELQELPGLDVEPYSKGLTPADKERLASEAGVVADFEKARVIARIQECLVKQPYISEDSLVNLAIPVVVEQKLDGSFLGLSSNLSADALSFCEPLILDLKFGEQHKFHRLQTTGYALAMEAIYEFPVNLGCVVYAEIRNGRLVMRKDIHIIDDELRQWFIEARDDRMRMIHEEIDPGLPDECPDKCYCYEVCRLRIGG
ncbi:type I-A CRISPR-associated protein Cas4/Csa1 [Desulforudis sp. 1088]|uniref:type I-A CRISPR-associated protein Cas4/Csa1 n=3 Tax=Candidatus Desulforudis TaxID=471826 RepID=UPI003CE4B682